MSQLFSVLAPLWRTDLPADVRTAESETTCFRKRLKTTCSELTWTPLSLLPLLPLPLIIIKTKTNVAIILCLPEHFIHITLMSAFQATEDLSAGMSSPPLQSSTVRSSQPAFIAPSEANWLWGWWSYTFHLHADNCFIHLF
ncbi:hypothetical protein N1851_025495 [Merluccius polli]|uniref:Uncharacterized protein n=1 Tax=Merluccius polli TaxID=89951 RepID=A0AA47MDQ1_MERPO|nr:hypothetical protein N1851_025495 [Merluccius polli]